MGRLHELCRKSNDTAAVKEQLASGASVDELDSTGGAPLHYASRYGNTDVVTALLDADASINPTNKKAQTPLYHAVVGQYSDIVKILLGRGADPNMQTAAGYFALHFAAREGLTGITKALLSNKAEAEAKTAEGLTPHALALKHNQATAAAIIKQFVETGSYEGVDDISVEAEDDEDAELMRELSEMEVQPTTRMASSAPEIRPPGFKGSGSSGGGGGGSGSTASPPKPGPVKAPTKDDDVDGFGKVYTGNAPAPHLLRQVPTAASIVPSGPTSGEVIYTPLPGEKAVEPVHPPDYYAKVNKEKVVEPQQTYDTYTGAMGGAGGQAGMEQYDNAEANADPTTVAKVDYKAPEMYDSPANPKASYAQIPGEPDYASVEEIRAQPVPDMASFLGKLGLEEKCSALADEAGIDVPQDFKMFSEEELVNDHKFKVGHIRKIFKAL